MNENHEESPITPTAPPQAPSLTRNVLATKQIVDLWGWCERNRENLAVTPNSTLAGLAQAELGFSITQANIANMLSEMQIEKRKPGAPPSIEEQVMRLADAWRKVVEDRRSDLETLTLLSRRVERVERLLEECAPAQPHPELGLPVPSFGETPPFRPEHFAMPSSTPHFPSDCADPRQ
jgi:hypothetical protein